MKTKSIVTIVASLAIGYLAGSLFGIPLVSNGNGKGSISKVSKHNKVSLSDGPSAFQEKLLNDTLEMQKAAIKLKVLTSRMVEFSSLVSLAVRSADNIPELEQQVTSLKALNKLTENILVSCNQALTSFNDLNNGNTSSNYEQASNNLALAYLLASRQTKVGKEFVLAVDEYMIGRDTKDFSQLALARDLWSSYCFGAASLERDQDEIDFWNQRPALLDFDQLSTSFSKYGNKTILTCVNLDGKIGLVTDNFDVITENTDNMLDKIENSDNMLDKIENTDNMLDKIENTDNMLDKIENSDNMLDKIENTDNMLDKIENSDNMLDKIENSDNMLDKIEITDNMLDKIEITDNMLEQLGNTDNLMEQLGNTDNLMEQLGNTDNM